MKMFAPFLTTRRRLVLVQVGLCLCLCQARAVAQTILTNSYTNSFPTSGNTTPFTGGSVASWINWYGLGFNNTPMTNDPTMDAQGNTNNSGSLLVVSPFGATGDQNVFFGTFDNAYAYDGSEVMPLSLITNIAFDIHVAPGTPLNTAGNFGTITMALIDPTWNAGILGYLSPFDFSPITIPASATNGWVHLSDTNLANDLSAYIASGFQNAAGVAFQYTSYSGYPTSPVTFWIDNVAVTTMPPPPPPALTHIAVNASQPVRSADSRWFGVNTAVWDGDLDTSETVSLLQEIGLGTLRFPGGSLSDDYHWSSNVTDSNTWTEATPFSNFAHLATNLGAQTFITVNYGTGSPAEAAAWVSNSNITNRYGFKYWEIGNECYGTWETDSNAYPHDPYTYATRVQAYLQQMKAADPTIKVGVVVVNGEDTDSNGYSSHPAINLVNGSVHNGWTPVLLSTLSKLGVTPDFAIFHWYPEYNQDNDSSLLQGTGSWAANAANLRQMITDYFGPGGTNIELVCTENNSDPGPNGKQSVSLVNGLYYADSLAQLMQTEFNSFIWWDLRNGIQTTGDMSSNLYGWRLYGDNGMINGLGDVISNRYPQFYTAKLMQYFIRSGDTVLAASSDYQLLSAYGARRSNGELTVLVINKDPAGSLTAQIALTGYVPNATAAMYSYGMPQDNADQTGAGSPDIAQTDFLSAGTNFTYTFPPYSATVFVLSPSATPTVGTIVWTNTSGGNWSVPANWSPNQVPGSSNTAMLPDVGSSYAVTLDVNAGCRVWWWARRAAPARKPSAQARRL
jgi:hypothetical protein